MLKEIAPRLERVALVANPKHVLTTISFALQKLLRRHFAIKILPSPVATAGDVEHTIETFAATPNGALLLTRDSSSVLHRDLIIALAAQHKLPAVYPYRFFVAAGGLMSYETDQISLFRLAASYVDRILHGDEPRPPVPAPTKFETTVNVRTAKALGLAVPPGLLVAADEVIE